MTHLDDLEWIELGRQLCEDNFGTLNPAQRFQAQRRAIVRMYLIETMPDDQLRRRANAQRAYLDGLDVSALRTESAHIDQQCKLWAQELDQISMTLTLEDWTAAVDRFADKVQPLRRRQQAIQSVLRQAEHYMTVSNAPA